MAAVLAVGIAGVLAHAQDVDPASQRLQRLMERFHKADVNHDGHLTREEAEKGMPRVYQHFAEIDTGNNGYVTLEQITAYLEAHPGPRARNAPPPGSPPTGSPSPQ